MSVACLNPTGPFVEMVPCPACRRRLRGRAGMRLHFIVCHLDAAMAALAPPASLADHIAARGLTDVQVAAELWPRGLRCTPQAVGLWKRGERVPRPDALRALIDWSEANRRDHGCDLAPLTPASFYPEPANGVRTADITAGGGEKADVAEG